jgi:anti-sigma regulatory factor (Ser/Thr protein kinase)
MDTQFPTGGLPVRLVYERVLPAVPTAVGQLRRELDAALARLDVSSVRRHDVALVLTEAAANVVVHAYPGAARPGLVYTLAALTGPTLEVDVFDAGGGMVPGAQSPGLGVGLALMARLADGLDITPNADRGLKVTAVFRDIATPRAPASDNGAPRAEHVNEYVAAMLGAHETLRGQTRALMAEAEAAVATAERLRRARLGLPP